MGYASQLRTVDYVGYAVGLARTRAFHHPVRELRDAARWRRISRCGAKIIVSWPSMPCGSRNTCPQPMRQRSN